MLGARCGQPKGQARWGEGMGGRGRGVGSGPREDSQEGSVSAWCEVRAAERANKARRGPGRYG